MGFFGDVVLWFGDHLWGSAGVVNRTWEHIQLSGLSVLAAVVAVVPIALWLGHIGRGGLVAVSLVNIGRAIPSFGIVALALPLTIELAKRVPFISSGLGAWPTFIALFALALPPIFTNTYTGIHGADRDIVEAARGMGLKEREILTGIELPLALPLILAGVRVAAVQVVATATLGALVAWGGLGRFVIDGFAAGDRVQLVAGALLVAALSVATEVGFSFAERRLVPRGVVRRTPQRGAPG
jgi:osmoprotectant transport system permease protein